MAENKKFYFVDTREGAKSSEPFAIDNQDVAKSWTREYNNGDGPFKPTTEEEFQKNRRDLAEQTEAGEPLSVKVEAAQMAKNLEVIEADHMAVADVLAVEDVAGLTDGGRYGNMGKKELQDELDARGIEYKKSGPESTNEAYAKLLEQDDANDE